MRTDEQITAEAKESINALDVEQLRQHLFVASILLELRFLDSMFPVLDDEDYESWLDSTWGFLHSVRSEQHMTEAAAKVNERVRQLNLLASATDTKQ